LADALGSIWCDTAAIEKTGVLKDKVVVISGAGPGLGGQLALAAVRHGARVALCARSQTSLAAAGALLDAEPGAEWFGMTADITDAKSCTAFVAACGARFGHVDALINNAFRPIAQAAIETADFDDWRAALETNFLGTLQLTRAAMPALKASAGAVVMINSMNTRRHSGHRAGAAASKGALLVATQYLARELGPHRIRVNTALMGWMWGPAVSSHFEQVARKQGVAVEQLRAEVERDIALGAMPSDADCADAAVFLASDHARAITGACLDVNGGAFLDH
jgi:NAD(P)-dependent dehydrogenase (short-subunit alcohol dehydrogenase family)